MDANMDELLDLCTGQFTSQSEEKCQPRKNDQKENMEELLNLCSGKFPSQGKYSVRVSSLPQLDFSQLMSASLKSSSCPSL